MLGLKWHFGVRTVGDKSLESLGAVEEKGLGRAVCRAVTFVRAWGSCVWGLLASLLHGA